MPFLRFRKCIRWSRRLFSAPLKMRRVPEKGVFGTEYPSRTGKACFLHRMLQKTRRVPEKAVSGTEYPSRTVEACFLHRMLLKMRRVPQEAFLSTECVFRTVEGPLRYRMPQTAERRRALPAANATTARKEETSAKSAARNAAASKKITAKKFAMPPQSYSVPLGKASMPQSYSVPPESPTLHRYLNQKSRSAKLTGFLVVGRRIELLLRD